MKVVFYHSDRAREVNLGRVFGAGVVAQGDRFEMRRIADYGGLYPGPTDDTDVACAFGVKGKTKRVISDHLAMGRKTIYFDKGYDRARGRRSEPYVRVAANSTEPTDYLHNVPRPADRFKAWGIEILPRQRGQSILFCGSSQKYCTYHGLGDATDYAADVLAQLAEITSRPLVYRPKPSWGDAVPVVGAAFDDGSMSFERALVDCHCMVTHGSGAAVHAILRGVPVITLGNGAAKHVSSTLLTVDDPYWPEEGLRRQFAYDISYCQWTASEFSAGAAWPVIRNQLNAR